MKIIRRVENLKNKIEFEVKYCHGDADYYSKKFLIVDFNDEFTKDLYNVILLSSKNLNKAYEYYKKELSNILKKHYNKNTDEELLDFLNNNLPSKNQYYDLEDLFFEELIGSDSLLEFDAVYDDVLADIDSYKIYYYDENRVRMEVEL